MPNTCKSTAELKNFKDGGAAMAQWLACFLCTQGSLVRSFSLSDETINQGPIFHDLVVYEMFKIQNTILRVAELVKLGKVSFDKVIGQIVV